MKSNRLILIAAALAVALGPALALAGPDTAVGWRRPYRFPVIQ